RCRTLPGARSCAATRTGTLPAAPSWPRTASTAAASASSPASQRRASAARRQPGPRSIAVRRSGNVEDSDAEDSDAESGDAEESDVEPRGGSVTRATLAPPCQYSRRVHHACGQPEGVWTGGPQDAYAAVLVLGLLDDESEEEDPDEPEEEEVFDE